MMERDKLYTVNKFNKFAFGGITTPYQAPEMNGLYGDALETLEEYNRQQHITANTGNSWLGIAKADNPFSKVNIAAGPKAMLNTGIGKGIAGAVGGIVSNAAYNGLSGGLSSGAGQITNGVANIAGGLIDQVNPALGFVVKNAGAVLGAGINNLVGTSTNEAQKAANDAGTASLNGFVSNASSFDDVKGPQAVANVVDAHRGGVFKKGWADEENAKQREQRKNALAFANRSVENNVSNIWEDQIGNNLRNSAAFGGPLEMLNSDGMGAIEYGFMSDYLDNKRRQAGVKDKISNYGWLDAVGNTYANGGDIHIKKSHEGRLTKLKKRTGKTEAELWAEGRPEVRKMITFVRNARKWKKAYGGLLDVSPTGNIFDDVNYFALGGPDDPPGTTVYRDVYDPKNPQAGIVRTQEFIPAQPKVTKSWEPVSNINIDYVPQYGGMYGATPKGMSDEDGEYYQKVLHDYEDYPITTYSYGYKKGAYQPYRDDYELMNVHNYPNGALGYDIRNAQGTTQYIPTKDGRWFRMTQAAGEMGEPTGEYIDTLPEFDFNKYTLKSTDGENYIGNPNLHALGGDKDDDEDLENLMFYLSQKEKYPNGRKKIEAEKFLNYRLGIPERKTAPWFEETPTYIPESPSEHLDRVLDTTSKIVKGIGRQTKKTTSKGEPYVPHVKFALGGDIQSHGADWSTGMSTIGAGGSHEENPYEGVQVGVDSEGTPNLVEENETIYNDYVYSNRIEADQETLKKFHLPRKAKLTYADITKRLEKEVKERPNDPISQAAFKAQMAELANEQERQKQEMEAQKAQQAFDSLSDEEKVGLMQYAQQREQEEQAMQEQAMMQQAQMQQPSPEEMAIMEQQAAQEQMMAQQQMPKGMAAYGGNLFGDGGALGWLKKNHPELKNAKELAAYMEKRASDPTYLVHKRDFWGKRTNEIDWESYYNEFIPEINSQSNRERLFNAALSKGLSRDLAFELSHSPHYLNSYAGKNKEAKIQERNEAYKRLVTNYTNPQKVTRYKTASGKVVNTKEEAVAENKAYYAAQQGKAEQAKPSVQKAASAPQAKAEKTGSGTQANTGQSVSSNTRSANTGTPRRQATASTEAPSRGSAVNVGTWKEGDYAQHWDTYSRPGLEAYLSNAEARYNMAPDEEEKAQVRDEVQNTINGIQNSYYRNILRGRGNTSFDYSPEVEQHQTAWQNAGGNTGFWSEGEDGSINNAIATALNFPEGHNTSDTPAGRGIDGYNGPQTDLRNFGSTEVGDEKYWKGYVDRFRNLGLNWAPNSDLAYGENLGKQLYTLSPLEAAAEEAREPANFWEGQTAPGSEGWNEYTRPPVATPSIVEEQQAAVKAAPGNAGAGTGEGNGKGKGNGKGNIVPVHRAEWPRFLGLFGPAVGLGMQALGIGKPDYGSLNAAIAAGSQAPALAEWMPRGDFAVYKPDDPWFYTNPIIAQSNAVQRGITNKVGPSKGAESLANGYNTMIALGNAQRQGLEHNFDKYMKVKAYNGDIYESNARRFDQNSQFNADARNKARQFSAQLGMEGARQRMDADAGWYNSLYGNVAGLFKGFSDLGRENYEHNRVADIMASGIVPINPDNFIANGYLTYEELMKNKRKNGLRG